MLRRARPGCFEVLRRRRNEAEAFLYAFDLLELDGTDLRREPIEVRKATLASILRKSRPGVRLNEHLEHPEGASCSSTPARWGCEGIVSKRLGSRYRSGRSPRLAQVQEPGGTGGEAGGRRGLGKMREPRLVSAGSVLPQPSRYVIQGTFPGPSKTTKP